MHDERDEVCNSALERPQSSPFIWRDAVRNRNAIRMLARQIAFQEVGQQATANEFAAYFKQHQARLIAEAANIIATRAGFSRYRFPRR